MAEGQRIYRPCVDMLDVPEGSAWSLISNGIDDERLQADSPVYVDILSGKQRTIGEALSRSKDLSKAFYHHPDLQRGRRAASTKDITTVGILSPNCIEYATVVWAALASGTPFVPMASTSTAPEAKHLFSLSHAALLFVDPGLVPVALDAGFPRDRIVLIEESQDPASRGLRTLEAMVREGRKMDEFVEEGGEHPVPASGLCYIVFSSGSTGKPKGVMTSHQNIKTALMASASWMMAVISVVLERGEPPPAMQTALSALAMLPSSHVYGLLAYIFRPLRAETTLYILRKFDVRAMLKAIAECVFPDPLQLAEMTDDGASRHKINALPLVPSIANQLIANPDVVKRYDLSSLTFIFTAAAALHADQRRRLLEVLARQGAFDGQVKEETLMNTYGMSETTISITNWPAEGLDCGPAKRGTVGALTPGFEARLVDRAWTDPEGVDVAEGESGELIVKSGSVMMGYVDDEEGTRASFTPGGWFKTGDEIRIDESGQLFFVDRLKETFKNRGLQVAPSEIAEVISRSLPDVVADVVVVGVPAPPSRSRNGEEAWAFIVLTSSAAARVKKGGVRKQREEEVRESVKQVVRDNLARHKWVEEVRFWHGDFPKGPTGKVLSRLVRTSALTEASSSSTSAAAKL